MELQTDCKCECASCGEVIEYRSTQVGEVVQCPKCGAKSLLPTPVQLMMLEFLGPPAPEFKPCETCGRLVKFWDPACAVCEKESRKKLLRKRIAIGVSVLSLIVIAGVVWHLNKPKPAPPGPARMFIAQPQARLPKSTKDLRPIDFTLSRQHGEATAVAVGDIRNDSLNVHHHVRADVDLLDRNGAKIGTVSDYFVDLGANQTWHFVVQVTDTNAMSIRFAGFKEDE
jgi:DNA-directed RNA polymerase subunit RPC12/RpoP